MKVEQFVMAYGVEQDRLRAFLPEGFVSLRPVEQQRHLWRLSGVYFVGGSASLGAIWEKTEVII